MSLSQINSALETAAAAANQVEQMAQAAIAQTGTAPTNAQKLQAAVAIASAVNPQIAADAAATGVIISALVSVFNLFGIFKKSTTAK